MKRRQKESQRGFALITVAFLAMLIMVAGLAFFDQIGFDMGLSGDRRTWLAADSQAEAGMLEILAHNETQSQMRDVLKNKNLERVFVECSGDPCTRSLSGSSAVLRYDGEYEADAQFLRRAKELDTDVSVEKVVYELTAKGSVKDGAATSEKRSQVYTRIRKNPGLIIPDIHAR